MFSEELEMLINAAITDGEITDKERAILHKRAQAEGVDTDELDLIINTRLNKLKKENEEEKEGTGPTAAQKLLKQIEELNRLHKNYRRQIRDDRPVLKKRATKSDVERNQIDYSLNQISNDNDRDRAIINAIRNLDVPKSKREYTDMLLLCKQSFNKRNEQAKDELEEAKKEDPTSIFCARISPVTSKDLDKFDLAYMAKAHEICDRINSFYPNDAKLLKLVKSIERSDIEFEKLNDQIVAVKEEKLRQQEEIKARKEAEEAKKMKNPFYRFLKKFQ